ncbi:MAG: 1-acyl-sn-glycerol-3-phosphate acyltransferase [Lachnospiraceae bacterium]|nr:1-acyl-sn-glycerol-3-phosphate acyltransferase [Lachnospiraceae bacterium]MBO5146722.1 1-acyl-sn-glycerol-3-phosphate acyltransferase [Lachnospiraceae bacterium]
MFSRFFHVIFRNLHHIYMIPQMEYVSRHPEKYSEEQMYALNLLCIKRMNKPGHITTKGYGMHNLPDEGGYIMCPNHQGKYDALGIMLTHEKPCSVVIDIDKSNAPLVKQFINLVRGKRMDRNDARQSIKIIREMAEETKKGRKFIIFPEGGYCHNGNSTTEFKPGAFKSAVWSKVPIVPVVLIDSYRVFEEHTLKPIKTFVYYLKPLYYADYKDMTTVEIAQTVQLRIQEVLNQYIAGAAPDTIGE